MAVAGQSRTTRTASTPTRWWWSNLIVPLLLAVVTGVLLLTVLPPLLVVMLAALVIVVCVLLLSRVDLTAGPVRTLLATPRRVGEMTIRPTRTSDADDVALIMGDPAVMQANGHDLGTVRQDVELVAVGRLLDALPRVICGPDDRPLGVIWIRSVDARLRECEIGWSVAPAHQRHGISSRVIPVVIRDLHAEGVRRVVIGTRAENVAVRKIAERAGALLFSRRPLRLPNGERADSAWYEHTVRAGPHAMDDPPSAGPTTLV
jgi:RimJ/RimL family protein N-acetyltransferase